MDHDPSVATTRPAPRAAGALAVVLGASGGLGDALQRVLADSGVFADVRGYSRHSEPALELTNEASIAKCAAAASQPGLPLDLVIDATGFLHDARYRPEKSWRDIDGAHMAYAFAVNSVGPALLMKHFLPLLPRDRRAVFATLSARVGSIADNRLGGWYSYRASKAALNQLVRTAAIELRRTNPAAICVALHPGTVDTRLSAPFAKAGLEVQTADSAAARIWQVAQRLRASDNGGFLDYRGETVPW